MTEFTDKYLTLKERAEGLYKEKGSRFISVAVPVASAEDVKLQLEKLRKEYHDARHHCYAYRIGPEPYESRHNDDGEPSGTAGKPILGQIQSMGLTNILIAVIRYFGGIKLGTGGLIQAYRSAARDALNNGLILEKYWTLRFEIRFEYLNLNNVMKLVKEENLKIIRQDPGEIYSILLEINRSKHESIVKRLHAFEIFDMTVI